MGFRVKAFFLIFLVDLKNKIDDYKINLCDELEKFGWFNLLEVKSLKTIGPDSPTGTMGQLNQIYNFEFLHDRHLHWPDLDIDLSLESLGAPEKFPLKAR